MIFNEVTSALVGYVTWRFREIHVRDEEPKREVVHIHYMGIDVAYRRQGAGRQVFATAEERATAQPRYSPEMPFVIEVELGNERARAAFVSWGFEHASFETRANRTYERMWRAPLG